MSVLGVGFSTYCGDDPDFEHLRDNLDQAQELEVDFVELPTFHMDLIAGGRILASQMRRLKAVLDGRPLGYTIHGPIAANFMAPAAIVARHEAIVKCHIEVSAELKAPHLVIHTGHLAQDDPAETEAGYERQRDAFSRLGEHAAQHGVMLVVENIFTSQPGAYTALPSRLAREIAAINHPHVKACLDFSHAAIRCHKRVDFLSEVQALAPHCKHLHVHDSFGDATDMPIHRRSERLAYGLGDLHLPIGWGSLPWDEIMSKCTFAPDVIFNLELPTPYKFALADSIEAMRAMVKAYQQARSG